MNQDLIPLLCTDHRPLVLGAFAIAMLSAGCRGSTSAKPIAERTHVLGKIESEEGPVRAATVTARRLGIGGSLAVSSAASDEAGRFSLDLPPGTYVIEGRDETHAACATTITTGEADSLIVKMRTVQGATVLGRVVDSGGVPVVGAAIGIEGELPLGNVPPRKSTVARTGANGLFILRGLRPGAVRLTARLKTAASAPQRLFLPIGQQIAGATLRMGTGFIPADMPSKGTFTVEGRSQEAGSEMVMESVEGGTPARDWFASPHWFAVADERGRYAFDEVPDGIFVVHERSQGGACYEGRAEVRGQDVRSVELRAKSRAAIAGVVRDSNGNPVTDAELEISSAVLSAAGWRFIAEGDWESGVREADKVAEGQHLQTRRVHTAGDGTFRASCLEAGPFEVVATFQGRRLAWADPARMGGPFAPSTVDLTGVEGVRNIELSVQACSGTIMGTVTDGAATPTSHVWVEAVESARAGSLSRPGTFTGPTGHFQLSGVCPGIHRVVARSLIGAEAASSLPVTVAPQKTEHVAITLEKLCSLEGRVRARGASVTRFEVILEGPQHTTAKLEDPEGHFAETLLLPGEYTLIVRADEGYAAQTVLLAPNKATEVALDLTAWSQIAGRLTDEAGAPLSGQPVQITFGLEGSSPKAEAGWPSKERHRSTRSDLDGRFTFDAIMARQGRITIGLPGAEELMARASKVPGVLATQTFPRVGLLVTPKPGEPLQLGSITLERKK